jgi:hypothetical protein
MKHVKIVALTAAVALVALLVAGSSNAIAAKPCSTSGTGAACAVGHGSELTTHGFSATSGMRAWKYTSGFITIECDSRTEGEFTHEGKATITSWTFTNCSSSLGACSDMTANASSTNPYSVTVASSGSGNGSVTIKGLVTLTYTCAGITCKYTVREMGGSNGPSSVTGSDTTPTLSLSSVFMTKEEGSSGFCSGSIKHGGQLLVHEPDLALDRIAVYRLLGEGGARPLSPTRQAPYQCTPFIRCAKATASVDGALSRASSLLPFAACESGKSL